MARRFKVGLEDDAMTWRADVRCRPAAKILIEESAAAELVVVH